MTADRAVTSAAPWLRIVLAVLLAVLLIPVVKNGLALALAGRNSPLALKIDDGSSAAQAQEALRIAQANLSPRARQRVRELASAAVLDDPTNAGALTALGLATEDVRRARRAMTASDQLSRRSLLAQLWLIEDAVQRGDIAGALDHYDIAMRVSRQALSILFPVLVSATSDDDLLPYIARTLARRPAWGLQYQLQLAQSGTDLPNIATLFEALLRRRIDPGDTALGVLFQRLADTQNYERAWQLYTLLRPGQPRTGVRNGDFARQPDDPVVFDWRLSDNQVDLATSIDRLAGGDRLSFSAGSGAGGTAARQLLLLRPGNHVLRATAYDTQATGAQRPTIRVLCAITGAEFGSFPLPRAGENGTRGAWRFTVPAGCSAQWLEIIVPAADSFEPNTGAISDIAIS